MDLYGKTKAKISLNILHRLQSHPNGKYVVVAGICFVFFINVFRFDLFHLFYTISYCEICAKFNGDTVKLGVAEFNKNLWNFRMLITQRVFVSCWSLDETSAIVLIFA